LKYAEDLRVTRDKEVHRHRTTASFYYVDQRLDQSNFFSTPCGDLKPEWRQCTGEFVLTRLNDRPRNVHFNQLEDFVSRLPAAAQDYKVGKQKFAESPMLLQSRKEHTRRARTWTPSTLAIVKPIGAAVFGLMIDQPASLDTCPELFAFWVC
jgi:hypothetical protein